MSTRIEEVLKINLQLAGEMDSKLGVAFSGGGIRSAAFCSGVLRRLLKKEAEPDYLSCVSGGGYTGSAYVEWKCRKGSTTDWTERFFENMRKRAGYFCNWQSRDCCCDSMILCALLFFVSTFVPIVGWGSFAFPIAFFIKLLYGKFLDGAKCRHVAGSSDCHERAFLFSISLVILVLFHFLEYLCKHCGENRRNYLKMKWVRVFLKLGQLFAGASFVFTLLPWFIHDFLRHLHSVIQVGVVFITVIFWFFVPLLRKYSSLVLLIYYYSYVVYWHLFRRKLFHLKYTKERFELCLYASLCIIAVFAILGDIPLRLVYVYNRWRLQKAFYYHEDNDKFCTCEEQCCYCSDLFAGGHCSSCCCASCMCPPKDDQGVINDHRAVTLGDLKGIKPEYLSNMVVNGWRRKYDQKYCLLTMCSKGISVIDQQPRTGQVRRSCPSAYSAVTNHPPQRHQNLEEFRESCLNGEYFKGKMKPSDVKLSSAMAMSAAAVSPNLGKHKAEENRFTHILTLLNMEMAAHLVYNMTGERESGVCHQFRLYFANITVSLLIGGGGFGIWKLLKPHIHGFPVLTTIGIISGVFGLLLVMLIIYICCCNRMNDYDGCDPCDCPDSCRCDENVKKLTPARWLTVHLPIYRFLLSLLNFIHDGPKPPAMLHLSDGGHFENYGLLPLLKLRLPRILVADGSHIKSDDDYADEIIQIMNHAREILGCSFTAMDGGDVLADIRNKYINPEDGMYPRMYEFKVRYSDKGCHEVREGHIVLISPRSLPTEDCLSGTASESMEMAEIGGQSSRGNTPVTWQTVGENLDERKWGSGPILKEETINDISGFPAGLGCCDCKSRCSCCDSFLAFPRHTTMNQFFTPRMFTVYHREGYRACMECDDFLKPASKSFKQPKLVTHV
ncbi:uncharacterized protein LOC114531087 isoform X1 [Dendronephthya gigantea]|uniref:uncharacterized protein LOC114531087 isoform X1 n=2 Tax=Dendronephthya gigantea TaxID=151771 RepID=UPI001069E35E|nr:uncharacterized protein LOC114531087 isoform X1 [Dendronephthya gigantea]